LIMQFTRLVGVFLHVKFRVQYLGARRQMRNGVHDGPLLVNTKFCMEKLISLLWSLTDLGTSSGITLEYGQVHEILSPVWVC